MFSELQRRCWRGTLQGLIPHGSLQAIFCSRNGPAIVPDVNRTIQYDVLTMCLIYMRRWLCVCAPRPPANAGGADALVCL